MPRGDGTGPLGGGSGRGMGSGRGQGGFGRGMGGGNRPGAGAGGACICPSCKTEIAHQAGVPCYSMKCPKCGATMMRK